MDTQKYKYIIKIGTNNIDIKLLLVIIFKNKKKCNLRLLELASKILTLLNLLVGQNFFLLIPLQVFNYNHTEFLFIILIGCEKVL